MMVKHAFYQQNNGHLSYSPPKYLTPIAKTCWRKVVPFLEATNRVQRIDSMLVEQYCVQYQEYRNAYDTLQKEGAQQKIYRSLQDVQTGKVIGKDFVGWKKNPAVGRLKDAGWRCSPASAASPVGRPSARILRRRRTLRRSVLREPLLCECWPHAGPGSRIPRRVRPLRLALWWRRAGR